MSCNRVLCNTLSSYVRFVAMPQTLLMYAPTSYQCILEYAKMLEALTSIQAQNTTSAQISHNAKQHDTAGHLPKLSRSNNDNISFKVFRYTYFLVLFIGARLFSNEVWLPWKRVTNWQCCSQVMKYYIIFFPKKYAYYWNSLKIILPLKVQYTGFWHIRGKHGTQRFLNWNPIQSPPPPRRSFFNICLGLKSAHALNCFFHRLI